MTQLLGKETIKVNWTKIHFDNLTSLAYAYKKRNSPANKYMPKVISDQTLNFT